MATSSIERPVSRLRRANELAFQIHARAWFLVNLFLVGIWALAGAGYFWPAWPALGWGFALVAHGAITYGRFDTR